MQSSSTGILQGSGVLPSIEPALPLNSLAQPQACEQGAPAIRVPPLRIRQFRRVLSLETAASMLAIAGVYIEALSSGSTQLAARWADPTRRAILEKIVRSPFAPAAKQYRALALQAHQRLEAVHGALREQGPAQLEDEREVSRA